MKTYQLLLFSLIFATLMSCKKDELARTPNCPFTQNNNNDGLIDDFENEIMTDCRTNQIMSGQELSNNLIGSWELIGHGEGWVVSESSQPCSRIEITEDALMLEYENSFVDTMTFHTWGISEDSIAPALIINPRLPVDIVLQTICENYMFGNFTFVHGQMHIYEKVD